MIKVGDAIPSHKLTAVTADGLFGDDEAIGRLVFRTEALEADA